MIDVMRVTVELPEDVYRLARDRAAFKAIAELVRQADKAFPTFELPKDSRPISLEQTLCAEDDL